MADRNILVALRDFFGATAGDGLKDAAIHVAQYGGIEIPAGTDWIAVEYEFNRLFVGPTAVPAPPFASAWAENDRTLMGRATLEARQAYHRIGLAVPREGTIPDDHLAYELEAVLVMKSMLPAENAAQYTWFVGEHLACWLPAFIQAAKEHAVRGGVIALVIEALATWFENECNSIAGPLRS